MPPSTMTMGDGATVSILARFIHPSEHIRTNYPNRETTLRLGGFKVLRLDTKKVSRQDQLCVIFTHDDFKHGDDYIPLHAVRRNVKITTEGPRREFFFDAAPAGEPVEPETQVW
jgi:hypothetical protein